MNDPGLFGFFDRRFGFQHIVYTIHSRQSLLNAVKSIGEVFRRVDDRVKQGDVSDKVFGG